MSSPPTPQPFQNPAPSPGVGLSLSCLVSPHPAAVVPTGPRPLPCAGAGKGRAAWPQPPCLAATTQDPVPPSPVPAQGRPPAPSTPAPRPRRYLVPEAGPEQSLLHKPLRTFVREVGSRSAAPGGGSVAAATAAMVSGAWAGMRGAGPAGSAQRPGGSHELPPPQGAALASMVGLMTYGRRQFEHLDATMRRLIPPFHAASAKLTSLVDADARAFEAYLVRVHTAPRPPAKQPQRERGLWTERSLGRVTEEGLEGRAGSLPSAPASRLGRAEPSGVGTGRGGRGEGHLPQARPGPVPPGPALSESPEGPAPRPSGAGAGQGPQKSSGPGKGGSRNLPREMLGVMSQRSERTVQPPAERATAELGPSSEAGRAGG